MKNLPNRSLLFIHGAFGGAWEFDELIESLTEQGHSAQAIDLPGHGQHPLPISGVTMGAYVDRVIEAAQTIEGSIVLVGHSLAGAIISQVAEKIPDKIERLVYVAATLPKNGETVLGLMQSDDAGQLLPNILFSEDGSFATVGEEHVKNLFLHDVTEPERVVKFAPKFAIEQATEPFMAPVELTQKAFGSVPKTYIRASLDKIMSLPLQDSMISGWEVEKIYILESGHFPMMSIPDRFLDLIGEIAAGSPVLA